MNTGIGDVVDLGWKLAAVKQGWGGPNLLASYSFERQPIGVRAIDNTAAFICRTAISRWLCRHRG